MRDRIKNLLNSAQCEIVMLLVVCCMIVTTVVLEVEQTWTAEAVTSTVVGTVVLAALLIWAVFVLATHRDVKAMPPTSRFAVEMFSRILFLFWIYLTSSLMTLIWLPFVVWGSVRSAKEAFATAE